MPRAPRSRRAKTALEGATIAVSSHYDSQQASTAPSAGRFVASMMHRRTAAAAALCCLLVAQVKPAAGMRGFDYSGTR